MKNLTRGFPKGTELMQVGAGAPETAQILDALEDALGGYVKRFRILDALYGSWQHTVRAVGEQLLASRVIPRGVSV